MHNENRFLDDKPRLSLRHARSRFDPKVQEILRPATELKSLLQFKPRAEKQERVFGRGWSLVKDLNAVQRSEPVRGCMAHLPPPTITTATAVDGLDGGGGAAAGATINCHWWAAADAGASVTTGGGGAAGAS